MRNLIVGKKIGYLQEFISLAFRDKQHGSFDVGCLSIDFDNGQNLRREIFHL